MNKKLLSFFECNQEIHRSVAVIITTSKLKPAFISTQNRNFSWNGRRISLVLSCFECVIIMSVEIES